MADILRTLEGGIKVSLFEDGSVFIKRNENNYWTADAATVSVLREFFEILDNEPEPPAPELPTEAGYYEGEGGDLWALTTKGLWFAGGITYKDPEFVRAFLPLHKLERVDG